MKITAPGNWSNPVATDWTVPEPRWVHSPGPYHAQNSLVLVWVATLILILRMVLLIELLQRIEAQYIPQDAWRDRRRIIIVLIVTGMVVRAPVRLRIVRSADKQIHTHPAALSFLAHEGFHGSKTAG